MKTFKTAIVATAMVALTACSQIPGFEPRVDGNNKSMGVLSASITYAASTQTMNAWFYVRKKGSSGDDGSLRLAAKSHSANSGGLIFSGMVRNIDFPDTPNRGGRVFAMSLDPGEYELHSWDIFVQTPGGYGDITPSAAPQPLPFTVKPGAITYLGSLHGQTVMGKNVLGMDVPASGTAEISDKSDRDLPMIFDKYPMLEGWPVLNAHLETPGWAQR